MSDHLTSNSNSGLRPRLRAERLLQIVLVLALGLAAGCTDPLPPTAVEVADPVAAAVLSVTAATSGYTTIDLGNLGGTGSWPHAINEGGQVIGGSRNAENQWRAFLWGDGVMVDLGTLGGTTAEVSAINDAGQVVGSSRTAENQTRAFLWENGIMSDLGTLGGANSRATAINNTGQVVGWSETAASTAPRPFLWENGFMIELETHAGSGRAIAVNDAGQVLIQGQTRAALWDQGAVTDLGSPGSRTQARAINNTGQIVGWSQTGGGDRPFLWENGVLNELEALGGRGEAMAINDAGQVLIRAWDADNHQRVLLWENGTATDLETLGGANAGAWQGLSSAGHVVGWSQNEDNEWKAFVWEAGVMTGLDAPGGGQSYGEESNDSGWIVGGSWDGELALLWIPDPPRPGIVLERLSADVATLEDAGVLNAGQAAALAGHLDAAAAMLDDGRMTPAVQRLRAFIRQVEGLVRAGILSDTDGATLIAGAETVIAQIEA